MYGFDGSILWCNECFCKASLKIGFICNRHVSLGANFMASASYEHNLEQMKFCMCRKKNEPILI